MSDMVKRVRKAIDDALAGHISVNPYDQAAVEQCRIGLDKAALAAIEAMREPTQQVFEDDHDALLHLARNWDTLTRP